MLLAAGAVACTDDADTGAGRTQAPTSVPPSPAAPTGNPRVEAAYAFAQCMRDHGIEDFADPQLRPDGDFFLTPPADVDDEVLRPAEAACEHLLPRPAEPGTVPTDDAVTARWERIVPGGDCQCSDGSEFSFWVRAADAEKFVFYLQDGGVCFSAETCAPERDLYNTRVNEGPVGEGGIFDFADARNPFGDYTVVYVPYCTGDAHLGDASVEYAPGLTIQHKGYVNASAALDHLATTSRRATDVVVVGESAGAIAAPLYAGLVADRLPDARVTVLADGSGSFPGGRRVNDIVAAWGLGGAVRPWPDADSWSIPGLFVESARHDPDIVFARHDYAYDEKQQSWYPIAGLPARDLLSRIDANETRIEAAGVDLASYIAPGDEHTALSDGTFYTEEVDGTRLVDWVSRLIEGEPVDDVHCVDCTGR